jgi:hypothetical protein
MLELVQQRPTDDAEKKRLERLSLIEKGVEDTESKWGSPHRRYSGLLVCRCDWLSRMNITGYKTCCMQAGKGLGEQILT